MLLEFASRCCCNTMSLHKQPNCDDSFAVGFLMNVKKNQKLLNF